MLQLHHVVTADGDPPTDLRVAPGETVFLLGPSGGLRTRLLHTVAGILQPRSGYIELNGKPIQRHDVGVVNEDRSLISALTAVENVMTRPLAGGPLRPDQWRTAGEWLLRLDLPESSLHNLAEQLSGGQQQRVAIARALMGEPAILSLDNPVSELDNTTAELVWETLTQAAQRGCIILVGLPEVEPTAIPTHSIHDTNLG